MHQALMWACGAFLLALLLLIWNIADKGWTDDSTRSSFWIALAAFVFVMVSAIEPGEIAGIFANVSYPDPGTGLWFAGPF